MSPGVPRYFDRFSEYLSGSYASIVPGQRLVIPTENGHGRSPLEINDLILAKVLFFIVHEFAILPVPEEQETLV